MKLENQVCTLAQAKRLKELGIEQRVSAFSWYESSISESGSYTHGLNITEMVVQSAYEWMELHLIFAAITVSELGSMLPHDWNTCQLAPENAVTKGGGWWAYRTYYANQCKICGECLTEVLGLTLSATEAEARAALLIYLLETCKTSAAEVNERLRAA